MASTPLSSRPANRPVKTCTECKQVKLRCDSRATFPAPCSRCHTKRLHCLVDSSFRRTPARRRVEEMARELEALKSQKSSEGSATRSTTSPSIGDAVVPSPANGHISVATAAFDYSELENGTFQLAGVTIDRHTIIDTLKIFSSLFYPHLPILDRHQSISSLYSSSPFLFWTLIMVVSARHVMPWHADVFRRLKEPYMTRLRSDILRAPLPLHTIQGLLYLIMYPLPVERQPEDASWLYSGIAINAAQYMGLHHSKPLQSLRPIGVHPGSPQARASTWLGCFLLNTSLSMIHGLSPSINNPPDLDTIEKFAREHPLPREFVYQVLVHHSLAKFNNVLLSDTSGTVSYSLVQLVDTELDGLKTRFPVEFTPRVEFSLVVAKLHLYAMSIIRMHADPTSRDILLQRGFSASVRLLYLSDQCLSYKSDDYPSLPSPTRLRTIPKNHFRSLILASIFLLRYFALNIKATAEEQEIACNHVALAHKILKSMSTEPNDEQSRGARLLETLSQQQPVDMDIAKLRIDNRMGASIVYDAITTGHSLRNENIEAEEHTPEFGVDPVVEQTTASFNGGYPPDNFDFNVEDQFDPMDFKLPEDLWGDSIWGMFDVGIAQPRN